MMERQPESSPTGSGVSRVQSIERAFAVLSRAGRRPDRRDRGRGARRAAEVDRRPDAGDAQPRGRGRAGPGRHALPAGPADRDARRGRRPGSEPRRDGAGRSSRSSRRRPARPPACRSPRASSSTTSTRSGRATRSRSATGRGRACRCTPCRPAWCSWRSSPAATLDRVPRRELEAFTPRTLTVARCAARAARRGPRRRLRLGPRGVRRGPELRRGRDRRRRRRASSRPSTSTARRTDSRLAASRRSARSCSRGATRASERLRRVSLSRARHATPICDRSAASGEASDGTWGSGVEPAECLSGCIRAQVPFVDTPERADVWLPQRRPRSDRYGERATVRDTHDTRLAAVPAAVDDQVDAVHGRVLEQEHRRVDDLVHRAQPARSASGTCSSRSPPACSAQYGLSPTTPGWIELTRIGLSSSTSVRVRPTTPPLTVVTVVEPGYGRSLAIPPNSTIDASSDEPVAQRAGRPPCSRRA